MLNNIGLAAVSRTPDNTVKNVFYRGSNGHLWLIEWNSNDPSGTWGAPADLGGVQLSSAPAAVSRNSNRIDVFYVGPNGHLWTSWWDGSQSQWWSAPTDLGDAWPASVPAAVSINPNRIDVFYVGSNGDLWTSWWDGSQSQWWSAATDLGGVQLFSAPAAAKFIGEIYVYYRGPDGDLWRSTWDPRPNIGGWSAPTALKTGVQLTTSPAAASYVELAPPGTIGGADGVDVYYGGPNAHLWTQAMVNSIGTISGTNPMDLGEVDFT